MGGRKYTWTAKDPKAGMTDTEMMEGIQHARSILGVGIPFRISARVGLNGKVKEMSAEVQEAPVTITASLANQPLDLRPA